MPKAFFYSLFRFEPSPMGKIKMYKAKSNCIKDGSSIEAIISEEMFEQAFIESYRLLCQNNKDVLDEFIARTEEIF